MKRVSRVVTDLGAAAAPLRREEDSVTSSSRRSRSSRSSSGTGGVGQQIRGRTGSAQQTTKNVQPLHEPQPRAQGQTHRAQRTQSAQQATKNVRPLYEPQPRAQGLTQIAQRAQMTQRTQSARAQTQRAQQAQSATLFGLCDLPGELKLNINSLNSMFAVIPDARFCSDARPGARTSAFVKVELPGKDPLEQETYVQYVLREGPPAAHLPRFYGYTNVWCDPASVYEAMHAYREKRKPLEVQGHAHFDKMDDMEQSYPAILCEAVRTPITLQSAVSPMRWEDIRKVILPRLAAMFEELIRLSQVYGFTHGDLHWNNVLLAPPTSSQAGRLVVIDLGRAYVRPPSDEKLDNMTGRHPEFTHALRRLWRDGFNEFTKDDPDAIWADIGGLTLFLFCRVPAFRAALAKDHPDDIPVFMAGYRIGFDLGTAWRAWSARDRYPVVGALGWASLFMLVGSGIIRSPVRYPKQITFYEVASVLGHPRALFLSSGQIQPAVYNLVAGQPAWREVMRGPPTTETRGAAQALTGGTPPPPSGTRALTAAAASRSALLANARHHLLTARTRTRLAAPAAGRAPDEVPIPRRGPPPEKDDAAQVAAWAEVMRMKAESEALLQEDILRASPLLARIRREGPRAAASLLHLRPVARLDPQQAQVMLQQTQQAQVRRQQTETQQPQSRTRATSATGRRRPTQP